MSSPNMMVVATHIAHAIPEDDRGQFVDIWRNSLYSRKQDPPRYQDGSAVASNELILAAEMVMGRK